MNCETVQIEELGSKEYAHLLSYPVAAENAVRCRITQLDMLGVRGIQSCGRVEIGGFNVLGKGCVGLVVKAKTADGWAALKIRRADADRADMSREAALLKLANFVGVGPILMGRTKDLILMELIDGIPLGKWLQQEYSWCTIEDLLWDCYVLDRLGLDHGELSDASKNVLVGQDGRAQIVDFDTASISRRPRNVTSLLHFVFSSGRRGNIPDDLVPSLRSYKNYVEETTFRHVIEYLRERPELWERATLPLRGDRPRSGVETVRPG